MKPQIFASFFIIWVCFLVVVMMTAATTQETVAVVKTPLGEIVWRFFPAQAPLHTAYVKELIKKGFYDGTTFHRVIPHYVAQGGDPNTKNEDRSDDGEGQADRTLKAEFSQTLFYRPGTVGMARDADPDSGSCQFFIALENLPRLNGKYTVFGEVIDGLNVAKKITSLPRDLKDNPLDRIAISVHLEERTVPDRILSLERDDTSGETLTGPEKRPPPFDPTDPQWKAPRLKTILFENSAAIKTPLELSVDEQGKVIDVRFPRLDTPEAATLMEKVSLWTFEPAAYQGIPRRVRFTINNQGKELGAP